MPHWETKGARIQYETVGEAGGWITLVNGHTRTLRDFRAMGNYLSDRGWRVLSLDNRGSGGSESEGAFTLDDMAGDVLGLWRALGIAKSHLLGISMGGMIAMTLAARRPAELTGLALVSTVTRWDPKRAESFVGKSMPEIEAEMVRYFSPAFAEKQKFLIRSLVRDLGKAFQDPAVAAKTTAQRRAMEAFDMRDGLGKITVPAAVLHGAEDLVAPLDEARALASGISGARLEIFPGVGHLLLAESARKFYEVAANFFAAVEGRDVES